MSSSKRAAAVVLAITCGLLPLSACDGSRADPSATASPSTSTSSPSSSASASPPASTSAGETTAALPARCTTSELSGELVEGSPGAGQRYAELVLTNTGGRTCVIFGYGGAQLVAADGTDLPTDLVRDQSTPPATVTLKPGGVAQSLLHWSVVTGTGDNPGAQCQPDPATLAVIPPDETTALDVAWTLGPVCEQGHLDQQPYVDAG
jgi:hypothetical protein